MRMRIGVATLAAIVLAGHLPAAKADQTAKQVKAAQACRIGATASKTRTEGQKGFWSDVTSTCKFDKAASKSTCTSEYVDSVGTKTTTVSVTTFASVADVIDEIKVIPPLRLSTKVENKTSGQRGPSTTIVEDSYDEQRRLIKESVTAASGSSYSTTYTSWDKSGRPLAGSTVYAKAPTTAMEMVYDDATRTVTTTNGTGAIKITCGLTYDANGNPASTECQTPGGAPGSMSRSTTTTTGTERICR